MEENFNIKLDGTTLTIILGDELTKVNAPAMMQLLSSSAGIRCVIYARRELGEKPEIVFENCAKGIYEALQMTGLYRFISFVEDNRKKRP